MKRSKAPGTAVIMASSKREAVKIAKSQYEHASFVRIYKRDRRPVDKKTHFYQFNINPLKEVRIELNGDLYEVFYNYINNNLYLDGGFPDYETLSEYLRINNMIAVNIDEILQD